jgi:hypothetical protein
MIAYCKFGLSDHSIWANIKHKGYSVQNMLCQLTHHVRNRTAETDANLVIIVAQQMHI